MNLPPASMSSEGVFSKERELISILVSDFFCFAVVVLLRLLALPFFSSQSVATFQQRVKCLDLQRLQG